MPQSAIVLFKQYGIPEGEQVGTRFNASIGDRAI